MAALPELDDATATNEDAAQHGPTTRLEFDAIVAAAAAVTATPRHERHVAARRVVAPVPCPPPHYERTVGGTPEKPVEMRRVGDSEWRCFGSRKDAAKAFGVSHQDVSYLIKDPSKAPLRKTFEARPSRAPPPRKRERPTKGKAGAAPPKKKPRRVEGAEQKVNGKWRSDMFPGREFDNLDEYRAAKKQRYARREEYREQNGIHR